LDLASVGREACFEIKPLELEAWFEILVRNPGSNTLASAPQLDNDKLLSWSSITKIKSIMAGVIPADYRGRFGWHNLRHSLATFSLRMT
jgi:hypothetical protein